MYTPIHSVSSDTAFTAFLHLRQTLIFGRTECHDLPKTAHYEQSKSLTPTTPPPPIRVFAFVLETSLGISADLTLTVPVTDANSIDFRCKPNEWR